MVQQHYFVQHLLHNNSTLLAATISILTHHPQLSIQSNQSLGHPIILPSTLLDLLQQGYERAYELAPYLANMEQLHSNYGQN